jgi:hypothetical protein
MGRRQRNSLIEPFQVSSETSVAAAGLAPALGRRFDLWALGAAHFGALTLGTKTSSCENAARRSPAINTKSFYDRINTDR